MWTLIRLEVFKLSRRLRSYIGFLGVTGIASLIVVGLYYDPPERMMDRMSGGQMMMVGKFVNAAFITGFVMPMLFLFFMPLFVSLVAGDMVAGEAAEGTLRTQLTRPVKRVSFLLSKYLVAVIYAFVLTVFLGFFSYAVGSIVFGQGGLLFIDHNSGTISMFTKADGLQRLALGYGLAAFGMLAVATIAFFLSTIVANSLGPVGISMMLLIVCSILGEIPYFDWLKPYLFTTHMQVWKYAFRTDIPVNEIRESLLAIGAYVFVFLTSALVVFKRKDILT